MQKIFSGKPDFHPRFVGSATLIGGVTAVGLTVVAFASIGTVGLALGTSSLLLESAQKHRVWPSALRLPLNVFRSGAGAGR